MKAYPLLYWVCDFKKVMITEQENLPKVGDDITIYGEKYKIISVQQGDYLTELGYSVTFIELKRL